MLLFEPKTARETPAVKILLNKSSKKNTYKEKNKGPSPNQAKLKKAD
jgi:hypothetical protein